MARFMTVDDVAEELVLSKRGVYALVTSGALPAIQVGGRGVWRIERARLEEYIERLYDEQRRRIAEPDDEQPSTDGDTDV
ncbi:helix-turn-helix domain-containing protein [Puerhibacterium sp. TATVAM-FAB25]|uniref:helix-turn-helix domain-containing protein n=1 Tax=Puerhibacterium sp. TATVAM-FAB25 TaxID=3093699 RepID=UPI00397D835D